MYFLSLFVGDVEFLLGLETFHTTAICSRETTVMVLNKTHLDRLFRKRSPRTLKDMSKMIETQLTLRCLKPNILETAPIMRCFLYKVQEQNGERKPGDEKNFLHTLRNLATTFETQTDSGNSRLPQAPATRSLMSHSETPDQLAGLTCDTPDQAHSHIHTTTSAIARAQRSKIILIPKVQV